MPSVRDTLKSMLAGRKGQPEQQQGVQQGEGVPDQQATRMQMSEDVCRQIVDRGWFDDTLPEKGQQIAQVQGQTGQQQSAKPAAAPGQAQVTPDAYAASPGPSNLVVAPASGIDLVRQPTVPAGSTWRAK